MLKCQNFSQQVNKSIKHLIWYLHTLAVSDLIVGLIKLLKKYGISLSKKKIV